MTEDKKKKRVIYNDDNNRLIITGDSVNVDATDTTFKLSDYKLNGEYTVDAITLRYLLARSTNSILKTTIKYPGDEYWNMKTEVTYEYIPLKEFTKDIESESTKKIQSLNHQLVEQDINLDNKQSVISRLANHIRSLEHKIDEHNDKCVFTKPIKFEHYLTSNPDDSEYLA